MKILLDQNLSFRIAIKIRDVFSGAKHVSDFRLENYSDAEIWEYARAHEFCIVTFDSDFIDISLLNGFPPKIIWLRMGNASTENLAHRLREQVDVIKEFLVNTEVGFLEIK